MPLIVKALIKLASNWRAILSLSGLVLATGFSLKILVKELGESAIKFWWIIALFCLVILGREFIRGYFMIKSKPSTSRHKK